MFQHLQEDNKQHGTLVNCGRLRSTQKLLAVQACTRKILFLAAGKKEQLLTVIMPSKRNRGTKEVADDVKTCLKLQHV